MAEQQTLEALWAEATAALEAGEPERALTALRQAWALAPADLRLPAAISRCLRGLNRHHEATLLLQQQLALEPEALPLQLAVVEALIDAGEVQQALARLLLLQPSGDAAALTPLITRLARLLLPIEHPALVAGPLELLQALQPVLPGHLLLLDGLHDDAVDAVATQLHVPGWDRLQGGALTSTTAHDLARDLANRCGSAAVVLIHARRSGAPATLWQTLAQQRGLNLAVVLVVSHPLQTVQRQRRRGISAQQSLHEWLQWAQGVVQPGVACEVLPYDTRRLPLLKAQALPWIDGSAPDPELLLQALELHQALLTAKPPGEVRDTPATAATVVQWLVDAAAREQQQGECRWAEWLLRLALELQPQQQGLYPALARCLRLQDRSGEAESLLRRHLVDDPQSAPGHIGLAELERERGRWQAAIDHYGEALALDPGHGGLPRALRHTAAHFFGPDDPRLEGTPEELLAWLRPGIPQRLLIVLAPMPGTTTRYQQLACTYHRLLESMSPLTDDVNRLTLSVSIERLEALETALQDDFKESSNRYQSSVLVDERQVCFCPLLAEVIHRRGLNGVAVLVNRDPSLCIKTLLQTPSNSLEGAIVHWLRHQFEIELITREMPRLRVDERALSDRSNRGQAMLSDAEWHSLQEEFTHADSCIGHDSAALNQPGLRQLMVTARALHRAMNEPDESVCMACVDVVRREFALLQPVRLEQESSPWFVFFRDSSSTKVLRRHLDALVIEAVSLCAELEGVIATVDAQAGGINLGGSAEESSLLNQQLPSGIVFCWFRLRSSLNDLRKLIDRMDEIGDHSRLLDNMSNDLVKRLVSLPLSALVLPVGRDEWAVMLGTDFYASLVHSGFQLFGSELLSADERAAVQSLSLASYWGASREAGWLDYLCEYLKIDRVNQPRVGFKPHLIPASVLTCVDHARHAIQISSASLIGLLRTEVDRRLVEVLKGSSKVALLDFQDHWNTGDSAIWLGQLATLRRIGVTVVYQCSAHDYDPVLLKQYVGDQPILLSGGGNLGDLWLLHQLLRERVINDFPDNPVIQLPQSICFNENDRRDYFGKLLKKHSNFVLMARDLSSYLFARDELGANTILSPDMAFGLDPSWLGSYWPQQAPADVMWLKRADKESQTIDLRVPEDWIVCDWLEQQASDDQQQWDAAAALGARIGQLRWALLEKQQADRALSELALTYERLAELRLQRGLNLLAKGKVILTDRLHAHILALFLNRPSVIMDNSYQKLWGAFSAWTSLSEQSHWVDSKQQALALAQALS